MCNTVNSKSSIMYTALSKVSHPVQCTWLCQKALKVGRRRGEDRRRIQEEEDRGERAAMKEDLRIKEAEEEKQTGNSRYERYFQLKHLLSDRYQSGDYPAALKHYTTALKLSHQDARILSSRAATYYKLGRWKQSLQVRGEGVHPSTAAARTVTRASGWTPSGWSPG